MIMSDYCEFFCAILFVSSTHYFSEKARRTAEARQLISDIFIFPRTSGIFLNKIEFNPSDQQVGLFKI